MKKSLIAVLCFTAAAGCGGTEPLPFELPPPDQSLDPARVVSREIAYSCGEWRPGYEPASAEFMADVDFNRPEALSPSPDHLRWIRDVGGTPLYSFHVSVVRVWMPTIGVEPLEALARTSGHTLAVYAVPNPARYDWQVFVKFKDTYRVPVEQRALVSTFGGRVDEEYLTLNMLLATIPDRSLKSLRADSRVEFVTANDRFCPPPELSRRSP